MEIKNLYIFAKTVYMKTVALKRKLIDIKPSVFEKLTVKARCQGVSLKRYIESLLEEDTADMKTSSPEGVSSKNIISLIGIAKGAAAMDWEQQRLHYLLSK